MISLLLRIAACVVALSAQANVISAQASVTVTDDVGREVTLPAPAARIVSLAPHLTEILFELGIGERIVGTVRYADFPEAARTIPRLGDAFSLNVEMLLQMNPDLVIAWYSGGASRSVERIGALGIPVYFNEAATLGSIAESARRIGHLAGIDAEADERATAYLAALDAARDQYSHRAPVRVFYEMSTVNLYTVNREHLIGQALALCGGENVFGATPIKVFQVSREAVVDARPQLILFTGSDAEIADGAWTEEWRGFLQIPAVKHGALRAMSPDIITRPSFRMAQGILELCRTIDEVRGEYTQP